MFDTLNSFLDTQANSVAESENSLYTLSPTVPNVLDLFYKNLERLGYNLSELKPALEQGGNSLIISCAGSGKTTFLELKLIHDYLSGELFKDRVVQTASGELSQRVLSRVFISTFLKTGAEELKNSFDEKCTELKVQGICSDNFTFSTLHAEYYAIITELGVKVEIMSEEELMTALTACCKSLSIKNRTRGGYGAITKDELSDIACIVGYARNRIDDARYKHPLCEEYGLTQPVLDKLLELYKKHRLAVNKYDFEDLQELVYQGITTNPNFAQLISSRYDYIFIDEFQDTSQIQYEVLKAYINGAKKTVAIGDDDQCIYSWRGSDVNIITKHFPEDYKPAVHKFTVNYRCRSGILAPVVSSIKKNTNRHEKDLTAYRSGGSVVVNKTCNVDDLMLEVRNSISNQYTVGILSRTNFDLLAPAILLELDGTIPFSLSKSTGITGYIPRQVFGCVKLLTRRFTEDFEDLLALFCDRNSKYEAHKLAEILRNQSELALDKFDKEDLAYSCPSLYRNLLMPMLAEKDKKSAYVAMLKYLRENVYSGDTPFSIRARLFTSFVIDIVLRHHTVKTLSIEDIDELFTDIIPNRLNKRAYSKKQNNCAVRLTTVHEAKGKEWQSVILWNDTDGVFPARVGKHVITNEEYEEERRLHYIAFTRAKERLTIFTSETKPSPYLRECDFKASIDVKVENAPSSEQTVFASKTVSPVKDSFRETLTTFMNSTDSDLSSKTMNLLTYYDYDVERVLHELRNTHKSLSEKGELAGADGNFDLELQWCVEALLITLMQGAYAVYEAAQT